MLDNGELPPPVPMCHPDASNGNNQKAKAARLACVFGINHALLAFPSPKKGSRDDPCDLSSGSATNSSEALANIL